MNKKYLLNSEKEKIDFLIDELKKNLHTSKNLDYIKTKLYNFFKNGKDYTIEEILNIFLDNLINDMQGLLTENITPGLQFGIMTDDFKVSVYGGYYNGNKDNKITDNTMFSFDSISKIIVSSIVMQDVNSKNLSMNIPVCQYNNEFSLDATIESILKFTSMIRTEKRIDDLSKKDTINILKRCKENLEEKAKYKNFYEYNDIGYMILRLSIDNFLEKLYNLLKIIDNKNLTYLNLENKSNITGGKLGEEYISPDRKGRGIIFPGHTGLYGNINGLLNLFYKLMYTNIIFDDYSRNRLFKQPYNDSRVYDKDGSFVIRNGKIYYMSKVAGIYRKPMGIIDCQYSKMTSCDMSELTTDVAKASTGTCGAWVVGDNIDKFGAYSSGILTNPYSFVEQGIYPDDRNNIGNTGLQVNRKGVILGYQAKLNKYKELMTEYSLILELITAYIKENDKNALSNANKKFIKKIR